ncbi:TetR/AcrR family transcriptional regulator [Frondihabitans cladoniiphilus]|uniref:HTH tetR-type domain-containing protein n=1 Tax=Frondihabitans cladoniiphilus TaxID=715785 RepID=A0ABP8VZW8_9MICO
MPKVTAEYREARRDEITAAAIRTFANKGFAGASMADIIAESGLSAGAIYGHFAGKHEIMMAVAREVIGSRVDDLREFAEGRPAPSPSEVLSHMLPGLSNDLAQPPLLLQVWGQAMVEEGMRRLLWEVFADLRHVYASYFEAWAREHEGMDETTARAWAQRLLPLAIGLGQGFIVQSAVFEDFDAEAYLASLREFLPH